MEENKEGQDVQNQEGSVQGSGESNSIGEMNKKGKVSLTKKMRDNPWMVSTVVLGILVLAVLFYGTGASCTGNVISEENAEGKIDSFLQTQQVPNAEIGEISSAGDSLYVSNISVQGQKMPLYITKDGEYLVQGAVPLEGITGNDNAEQDNTQDSTQNEQEEVPKEDNPNVGLYVMSFCPYGNKAENTMESVYNSLKDSVNFSVHYIVNVDGDKVDSLHGQKEVDQNIREVCVKEEYGKDKFWEFMTYVNDNCGSEGACWEEGANELGIDAEKIKTCVDERGLELMKEEAQKSKEAGASGSPTLLINGVNSDSVYQYGDSEAYKQAICSAFTEGSEPEECSEVLDSSGSSSTTTTAASC